MKSRGKTQSLTLTLTLTATARDRRLKQEPLGDLLNEAMEVLKHSGFCPRSTRWLAEQATRALCEQIILTRQISLPVEITFTGMEDQTPAPGYTLRLDNFDGIQP